MFKASFAAPWNGGRRRWLHRDGDEQKVPPSIYRATQRRFYRLVRNTATPQDTFRAHGVRAEKISERRSKPLPP